MAYIDSKTVAIQGIYRGEGFQNRKMEFPNALFCQNTIFWKGKIRIILALGGHIENSLFPALKIQKNEFQNLV